MRWVVSGGGAVGREFLRLEWPTPENRPGSLATLTLLSPWPLLLLLTFGLVTVPSQNR